MRLARLPLFWESLTCFFVTFPNFIFFFKTNSRVFLHIYTKYIESGSVVSNSSSSNARGLALMEINQEIRIINKYFISVHVLKACTSTTHGVKCGSSISYCSIKCNRCSGLPYDMNMNTPSSFKSRSTL